MMGTHCLITKARLRFNIDDGKATMYKQTLMSKIEPAKVTIILRSKSLHRVKQLKACISIVT